MQLNFHPIDSHVSKALCAFLLSKIGESVRPYLQCTDLRDLFAILEHILQIFLPSSPTVRSQLTHELNNMSIMLQETRTMFIAHFQCKVEEAVAQVLNLTESGMIDLLLQSFLTDHKL